MCGVVGIIGLTKKANVHNIVGMNDLLAHRGPDGEGFLFSNELDYSAHLATERPQAIISNIIHTSSVAFGHRRLSIIDLSVSAGQPMADITGRYRIVFNGEIYNHRTLRSELEQEGFRFKTDHSDTEVILNAYACWGTDCLKKFNGMWAFCIWDIHENTYFLARDRAGKKPLFYTIHEGVFYFASELKSLLLIPGVSKEISNTSVYSYLAYHSIPAPQTLYKNIYKLPAAHYILLKSGSEKLQLVRYWNPLEISINYKLSIDEIYEEIRGLMREAANYRMIADVEVGMLLSGGVDSSITLAVLSQATSKPIKTFSVGFEETKSYKNEFKYAQQVAKQFHAEYHELVLEEDSFGRFLNQLLALQDEPISDTANIPIYYISKTAREKGITVLLGGEGSDELFIGYQLWQLGNEFQSFFKKKPVVTSIASAIHALPYLKGKRIFYKDWYQRILSNQPVIYNGSEIRNDHSIRSILSKEYLNSIGEYTAFSAVEKLYCEFKESGRTHLYDWLSFCDLNFRLPESLLARFDKMSMAASIEGRTPFMDVHLMEFAFSIPPELKVQQNEGKYLLKKAFEGTLPDNILYRQKDGFTVPMGSMLYHKETLESVQEQIGAFNKENQIFNTHYLDDLYIMPSKSKELWNVLNLAIHL